MRRVGVFGVILPAAAAILGMLAMPLSASAQETAPAAQPEEAPSQPEQVAPATVAEPVPAPAPGSAVTAAPDQQAGPPPASGPAQFNDALSELEKVEASAFERLRANDLAGAIPHVTEALRLSEKLFGPDAAETGSAAQNLGFLLTSIGRHADALPALERALAIYERTQPPGYENTAKVIAMLGDAYMRAGRQDDAVRLTEAQIARAQASGAPADAGLAAMHVKVAGLLRTAGRDEDAAKHWQSAIDIYKAQSLPQDEGYRAAVNALLEHDLRIGKTQEARGRIEESLEALRGSGQEEGKTALVMHINLARLEHDAGRHAEARQQALAALAILEREGQAATPQALDTLTVLARAEQALADDAGAAEHYKRAIAILDAAGDAANSGLLNDDLAQLLGQSGRADEAEPHHKRAMELTEQALGRDHASTARAAANFGVFLNEAGRFDEAEPLLRRGLAIAETQSPQDAVLLGTIHDSLSGLLRQTGRADEAMEQSRKALALRELALPSDHPSLAASRIAIGRLLLARGEHAEAEMQLRRALEVDERVYGGESPRIAAPAMLLGETYAAMGRLDEGRTLLTRALGLLERQHGAGHGKLLGPLVALGQLEATAARPIEARAAFERAAAVALAARSRSAATVRPGDDQRPDERRAYEGLLQALWLTREEDLSQNLERALEVSQWETLPPAALAALAAGAVAGDPEAAALTRQRQDAASDWQDADSKLTALLAQTPRRDAAAEQPLRERLAASDARLTQLDQELQAKFPRFVELVKPASLTVKDVQALLRPNEAALQYIVTPEATYAWVISASAARWLRLPAGERDLLAQVGALRCGLDRAEWQEGAGQARCAGLLGLPEGTAPGAAEALPFPRERAHTLYGNLLGQLAGDIQGKDLLIVATGPLTALPFPALVSDSPQQAAGAEAPPPQIAWLGRAHAVAMLPSLASLKTQRLLAQASRATTPYLGLANPLLTGADGSSRSAWDHQACASAQPSAPSAPAGIARTASLAQLLRSGMNGVEALRRQPPLPETAEAVCGMAKALGADANAAVLLGGNATEARIKSLSQIGTLAHARILHLATHALIDDETAMLLPHAEPGLVLTPPDTPGDTDDGLLTASEIAALKLDADWVVLSASRTAGGDKVGAQALSGLARAFFHAGARALMVSHWSVDSAAAVKLMTAAFAAMAENPGLTQAGALQRATVAMMDAGGQEAQPAYWAAFTVIGGEGPKAQIAEDPAAPIVIPPLPGKGPVFKEVKRELARQEVDIPPPPERLVLPEASAAGPLPPARADGGEEEAFIVPPLPTRAGVAAAPRQRPGSSRRAPERRRASPASTSTTTSSSASAAQPAAPAAGQVQPAPQSPQAPSPSGGPSPTFWNELFGQ